MKKTTRWMVAAVAILYLTVSPSLTAGPIEDANAALGRHDYATALRLLRPLAEQGDPDAQDKLGKMYDFGGRGVAGDPAEALKWYRKAAEQGNADAQNDLGNMYSDGLGPANDYAEAVKWFLAAAVTPSRKKILRLCTNMDEASYRTM
jgi:TPR repeat protein